jgi:hypothetical protein
VISCFFILLSLCSKKIFWGGDPGKLEPARSGFEFPAGPAQLRFSNAFDPNQANIAIPTKGMATM